MTEQALQDAVLDIAGLVGPDRDEILREMDEKASEEQFPTVGPEVGTWLSVLARTNSAERVFEFGSGFGYSAYWFARGLTAEGEIVLTEIDEHELAEAEEYFERAGIAEMAAFEHGDAIEIVERYDGPFDIVLIDNEKHRYDEALRSVEAKLRPGSLVLADNMTAGGSIDAREVAALLSDGEESEASEMSAGIATYLDYVRDHDRFETALLPLGEGVAVSVLLENE